MIRSIILAFFLTASALAGELKTYYCIQVSSNFKLTPELKKIYIQLSKKYPNVRVEKISNYFTLRVGFWKDKRTAKKYLKEIKEKYKTSFLRTCYLIPSRWILPYKKRKKSNIKARKRRKVRNVNFSVQSVVEKISRVYIPTPIKFTEFSFPETRKKKKRKRITSDFEVVSLFGNRNFQKYNLSFFGKKFGFTLLKDNKFHIYPLSSRFLLKKSKNFQAFYIGINRRISRFEDLSSFGAGLTYTPFPLYFNVFIGDNFFRNGANDVSLEGLKFVSCNFDYKLFPDMIFSSSFLYENKETFGKFDLNRKFWGNFGLNYRKFFASTAFSSLGGYLTTFGLKSGSLEYGVSLDRNLPYPLTSKGRIFSENSYDLFFNLDPLDINRFFISFSKRNFRLAADAYTSVNGKKVVLENRTIKKKGNFIGISIGAVKSLRFNGFRISFGGGIFLPGNAFTDKSAKYRLKLKVNRKW